MLQKSFGVQPLSPSLPPGAVRDCAAFSPGKGGSNVRQLIS